MIFRFAIFLGAVVSNAGVGAFAPHSPTSALSKSHASSFALQMSGDAEASEAATVEVSEVKAKHDFALLFDCDGVILETEELHRLAYNAAFQEFKVTKNCGAMSDPVEWSVGYYDILQNSIGGGIPKMRHFFSQALRFESNEHGDPTTIVATMPSMSKKKKNRNKKNRTVTITANDISTGLETLIESIQTRKTELYKTTVEESATPRPGLVALMDEALADDSIAVGVCSASTKAAAQKVLECTLGAERVSKLDVCILGDDVSEKKPSPMIYNAARAKLGIDLPTKCVVVEDSAVGLRAAKAAGMRCLITYTASTTNEDFYGMGADAKVPDLANNGNPVTLGSIFAPLREAFPSEEDQFPELLVGLKDEAVEEDEEEYDEDDNLIWNTVGDDSFILLEEDESDGNVVEIDLTDDNLVFEDVPVEDESTEEVTEDSIEEEAIAPVEEPAAAVEEEEEPVVEKPETVVEEEEIAVEEPVAEAEEEPVSPLEEEHVEEPVVEEPEVEAESTPEPQTPKPAATGRILKPKLIQDDMGNFSM